MQPPDPKTIDLSAAENPLILFGASVRAAAQSAKRGGFDVFGIDLFGDTDTQEACRWFCTADAIDQFSSREIAQCVSGRSTKPVPLMVVGGDHQADPSSSLTRALQSINKQTRRVGPSSATEQMVCDPEVLSRIAIRSRTYFPPYRMESVSNHAADVPGRWLSKSTKSSGGLGVRWTNDLDNQADQVDEVRGDQASRPSDFIRQRWQPGRSYGATFLSDGSQFVMLGVCRSLFTAKGQNRFVYAGSWGPIRIPQNVSRQLLAIGNQIVIQTGLSGLINVDVLIDPDQNVTLLEINPRWSASMECIERSLVDVTHATNSPAISLIAWGLAAAQDHTLNVSQRRIDSMLADCPRHLKRILYARKSGRIDSSVCDQIQRDQFQRNHSDRNGETGFDRVDLCDRPADGASIGAGEPFLSVVCRLPVREKLSWRKTKRLIASLQRAVV